MFTDIKTITILVFVLIFGVGALLVFFKFYKNQKFIARIEKNDTFNEETFLEEMTKKNKYRYIYEKIEPRLKGEKGNKIFNKALKVFGINLDKINKLIDKADLVNYVYAEEIALIQISSIFIAPIFFLAMIFVDQTVAVIGSIVALILVYIAPLSKLKQIINEKKLERKLCLANFVNLVADTAESGNTIQRAIMKVSSKYNCILSKDFLKAELIAEKNNGLWVEELQKLSDRIDIDELTDFINDVVINKDKGMGIVSILKDSSKRINLADKFAKEEKARKLSYKLLFPTFVFLLLPMMLIIMLPTLGKVMDAM